MSLASYADRFSRLRCGRVGDHVRPHKPAMLLAVIDLIESGRIRANEIRFTPELMEVFKRYFDVVRSGDDSPTPIFPFFHLRGDGFWHHQPKRGYQRAYDVMDHPRGAAAFRKVVDHAHLDDELFSLLQDTGARNELRDVIVSRYFAEHRRELLGLIKDERDIGLYERAMRERARAGEGAALPRVAESARDAAFARVVREAYDYRCAACGLRIIHPEDGTALVDAAHLVPFSESHDDDPRNGMALCRNHHWAMDRFLLAPCRSLKWRVSGSLDERIEGQRDLLGINNRKVLVPGDKAYWPKKDSLAWREAHLLKTG